MILRDDLLMFERDKIDPSLDLQRIELTIPFNNNNNNSCNNTTNQPISYLVLLDLFIHLFCQLVV